jgi:hypothetical protein
MPTNRLGESDGPGPRGSPHDASFAPAPEQAPRRRFRDRGTSRRNLLLSLYFSIDARRFFKRRLSSAIVTAITAISALPRLDATGVAAASAGVSGQCRVWELSIVVHLK